MSKKATSPVGAYVHLRTTTIVDSIHATGKEAAIVEHETFALLTENELARIRKRLPGGSRKNVFVDAYWAESETVELCKVVTAPAQVEVLTAFLGKRKVVGTDLVDLLLEEEDEEDEEDEEEDEEEEDEQEQEEK